MKKLGLVFGVLAVLALVGWQYRLNVLMWMAPKLGQLTNPIGPNVAIEWGQGPSEASTPPAERPPNIILILADDMGFNDISLYNGGAAGGTLQTPSIDALARDGVRFNNGYAANAVCAPSRASIMTGRYSTRFGFEFTPFPPIGARIAHWMEQQNPQPLPTYVNTELAAKLPPMTDLGMPPSEFTIAEALKAQGYYTAHIGKWHLGSVNGMRPEQQGFDDSLYMKGMLYLPEHHPDVVNAKRMENGIERMVWTTARYAAQFNGGDAFEPDGFLTDYYTNEAVKVIEGNRNRPFFLYLAHWGIHNPLQALRADYDALAHIADHHMRVYGAMITSLDRSVRKITEALAANGLAENTLIVFTSDNGGASYVALPDLNKPYRGWKLTQFEGGTHVPFMAKWPAQIPAGTTVDDPIHHIDLFPTMVAAAGGRAPADVLIDGVDLLPFVLGERAEPPHDTLFWREGYQQSVQHKGWKLIRTGKDNKKWLFNLATDPTEKNNLSATEPAKLGELEALLLAHNAEQAPPMWPSVLESAQPIDQHGGVPLTANDEYIYWPN